MLNHLSDVRLREELIIIIANEVRELYMRIDAVNSISGCCVFVFL